MNSDLFASQIRWSRDTFGPGPRVKGNTAHVLKELLEFREDASVEEAVDVAMLGMDGLWRQLAEAHPAVAHDAVALARLADEAYSAKLEKNRGRPFVPTPPDVPSEGRPGKWKPTDAVFDVLAERRRQVEGEGWTPAHDDAHDWGELAGAASAYALHAACELHPMADPLEAPPASWTFDLAWWKPGSIRQALVKAAALIIAEIERLDRKTSELDPARVAVENCTKLDTVNGQRTL